MSLELSNPAVPHAFNGHNATEQQRVESNSEESQFCVRSWSESASLEDCS